MNIRKIFVMIIFVNLTTAVNCFSFVESAKLTIRIIGENGESITNATVGIGFDDYRKQSKENSVIGQTDSNGYFSGIAPCTSGYVGFNVKNDGYYMSKGYFEFKKKGDLSWEPWNPTINVVLRKIENPVPMYARHTKYSTIEIPVQDENVGFDLIKFDWVIPYGSGTHADFIFHLKRRVVDRKDFDSTLTVTFSNKYDGIQPYREELGNGSLFKLPRYAPETGYEQQLELREWRSQGEAAVHRNFDFNAKDLNYIFRVRSKEESGEVTEAMYGKIIGGLRFDPVFSKTGKIFFKYYLNPDHTRNLEFDPKRNLFDSLPLLEQVGIQ
jgi:hypothetical protein